LAEKLARPENRDIGNVELIEGSAHKIPFSDASLDLVYLISVLQEIPRRPEALTEMKRVLKPGGILAVSEVLMDIDYFLKSTVIKMAGQAGFILDGADGNLWSYTVRFTRP
jgi:ubiquinone/menaquinone biosynthesis C-methylase UbiE